jgi:hypothetical protein
MEKVSRGGTSCVVERAMLKKDGVWLQTLSLFGAYFHFAEMRVVPLKFLKGKLGDEIFHMGHSLMEA